MAVRVPSVMRRVRSARFGRPRLPARLSPRRARIFAFVGLLGPGLIAANAGNDAGGVATYSSAGARSEEHTSELQSRFDFVCRLVLEKKHSAACFVPSLSCHLRAIPRSP